MTTVREVMSKEITAIGPSTTVAEAATVMGQRHVGSALVMDEGSMIGIFTERDVLRALAGDFDAGHHPVSHWMTRNPETTGPDATARDALDRMLAGGFRHLPVLDEESVVGIVSIRDLARVTAEK